MKCHMSLLPETYLVVFRPSWICATAASFSLYYAVFLDLFLFRRVEFEEIRPAPPKKCECPCFHPKRKDLVSGDVNKQGWSRLGPMGPLLDPKLYPVKFGKTPESAVMRLEQPNRFLVKVWCLFILRANTAEMSVWNISMKDTHHNIVS